MKLSDDLAHESFQNLPWLEYLDVSNTSIDELPLKVFHNNTRMKELRYNTLIFHYIYLRYISKQTIEKSNLGWRETHWITFLLPN